MSIWHYEERQDGGGEFTDSTACIYCSTSLNRSAEDEKSVALYEELAYGRSDNFTTTASAVIRICPACGWWSYSVAKTFGATKGASCYTRIGSLRSLDLADVSNPIHDVRDYLMAHFDARFDLHPRKFEEIVASVFKDHGYGVRVTAYSGDGGIDVILDSGNSTIGVQVKRYKNKIAVDQIRELTGALVIEGHTRGIFVTTSEFQAGAARTVACPVSSDHG